ncbi:MAG: hypothetical protein J3Q66DRAFT_328468 [Benniella sp.]|nr:MAG: hypothetical protein J3Q66DRAFT_328468 [Benniella sp.]
MPLVIHVHSAALWAIYVTFCQLGDNQDVPPGSLESIFHQNVRRRACEDWISACQKDKAALASPIRLDRTPPARDKQRAIFKTHWSVPPHIEATPNGPKFCETFMPP